LHVELFKVRYAIVFLTEGNDDVCRIAESKEAKFVESGAIPKLLTDGRDGTI
jgi:hypothetical protein